MDFGGFDYWDEADIRGLLRWAAEDSRRHVAISNPKFELFLVMHFERANGCTTPQAVNTALRKHMPRYDKRLTKTQFRCPQIEEAVANAILKRKGCKDVVPAPGMTDVHLLVQRLLPQLVCEYISTPWILLGLIRASACVCGVQGSLRIWSLCLQGAFVLWDLKFVGKVVPGD